MIGEIRDSATAHLAIQAAQTGHLVLSTLHTRNARGALTRLKNLGIDQESLESCLLCVSSQRLVRKLCPQCKDQIDSDVTGVCSHCNGNRYFGRIGVHEILSSKHLFDVSLPFISLRETGILRVNEGLIDRSGLEAEVCAWH